MPSRLDPTEERTGRAAAAAVAAILLAAADVAAGGEEVRCLTGNAARASDNARVDGRYSVLMPGLVTGGWPKGPEQKDVPFARGVLTDGSGDTLLEWDDREFGALGRDVVVDLGGGVFPGARRGLLQGQQAHRRDASLEAGGRAGLCARAQVRPR